MQGLQVFSESNTEAVQGKKIIYLYRLLKEAATESAKGIAFTTENGRTKSKDADTTATKDGTIRTPGALEVEITATSILAKGDTTIDKLEEALDNDELLEIWEVNLLEKGTSSDAEKFKAKYFQGYLTELEYTSNAEDNVEVSLTFGCKIPCEISTGGYVTGGGNQVIFSVPLSKPLVGVSAVKATTNNGFRGRQGGKYTHGSSASAYAKPASYSCYVRESWIEVRITINSTTNVNNNDAIGIAWSGYLTFS